MKSPTIRVLFSVFLSLIFSQALNAQTIETEWLACNVYPDTTYLKFENDTIFYKVPNLAEFEDFVSVSLYTLSADTLFWNDLASSDQCEPAVTGKYIYQINGNELSFQVIEDECYFRLDVLSVLFLKTTIPVHTASTLKKEIKVYPNPLLGPDLFIAIEEPGIDQYHYEFFDLQGRLCQKGKLDTGMKINMAALESGHYFLLIKEEMSNQLRSFKIQKI